MASNPIFRKSLEDLKHIIAEDIRFLDSDYPEYDVNGKKKNVFKAREYANKLRDFLSLEYFKGGIYKYVRDIVGNLKFWAKDSEEKIEKNKIKIDEVKRIKKLKGQISMFDKYSLSYEEMRMASSEPDSFIQKLKDDNKQLEKDLKLARFCLAYLMRHEQMLRGVYESGG